MITNYLEYEETTRRAMKAARLSWSTEHLSSPEKDLKLMSKLLRNGADHSASLRQAPFWFHLNASRSFWQEYAKYQVGACMYSESTMHTLKRKPLTSGNFYRGIVNESVLNEINQMINDKADLVDIKCKLPEGFLQRRAVMINYPVAYSMFNQRWDHKWPEWKEFLTELLLLVKFPSLVDIDNKSGLVKEMS